MTVKEMIEVLSKLDPNKKVTVWNCEQLCASYVNEIEVDEDGDVVLY